MEKKNNNTIYALLLVIVALIGAVAYLYITKNKTEMQLVSMQDEKVNMQKELSQMEGELTESNNSVNKLTDDLKVKDTELRAKIEELKAALKRGDLTLSKLQNARNEIDQLRYYIKKYQGEIIELKSQNEMLTNENTGLKITVDEEKAKSNELTTQNVRLSNKVAVAAMLKTYDIDANGVRYKASGEEMSASRAKNTEKVKVTFKIAENTITDVGEKTIYLRVINPLGGQEVVTDENSSNFRGDGQELQYTAKTTINFINQKDQVYSIYWNKGSVYEKGTYKILLYADGLSIGSANLKLN